MANDGLLHGGGITQLGVQALGVFTVAAFVLTVMFVVFKVMDKLLGLRVSREEELKRIIELTPLERILIETDSPYHLLDSPKRFILPKDVVLITDEIAVLKEIEPKDFAEQVMNNAKELFRF